MNRIERWLSLGTLLLCLAACGGGGGGGGGGTDEAPGGSSGGGSGEGSGSVPDGGGGGAPSLPGSGIGGTGVELEGGVSGTGLNFGPIQGFSSVIVNGLIMDVSGADIFVEGEPATQADLREGQTVSIIGDLRAQEATDVRYRSLIRGPLNDLTVLDPLIGSATATIFGQAVRFNAATLYDGTALERLNDDATVEISGQFDQSGVIVASYLRPVSNALAAKLVGSIEAATATTVVVRGITFDFGAATLIGFDGAMPEVGDQVDVGFPANVFGPGGTTREALSLERLPQVQINEDADLELEGFVTAFTGPEAFDVAGIAVVTTATTEFEQGDADDLELNAKLEVEGTVNFRGELVAESISFRPLQAVRAEGPVEAIDPAAGTVQVLGVTFAVRATTELEDESSAELESLTLDDLALGQTVEVRGFLEGTTVVAAELDREEASDEARLRAPVTVFDALAGTLSLFEIALTTSATTEYEGQDEDGLSQAEFFALLEEGLFVEASWDSFSDTTQPVDALEIEDDD